MPTTVRSVPGTTRTNGHTDRGPQDISLGSRLAPDVSLHQAALIAGLALLLMTFLTPFANFGVLHTLIVPGDAHSTAQNIAARQGLFRIGIAFFFVTAILDMVVGWALYIVFRPLNRSLSLLAALLRVTYATMLAAAVTSLVSALQLVSGADLLKGLATDQLQAEIMVWLSAFQSGWDLALIIFGLDLFILGSMLVFQSGWSPRIMGILVIIAGMGYFVDGVGTLLVPNYSLTVATYTFIGEPVLMVWLLWKGIKGFTATASRQAHTLA